MSQRKVAVLSSLVALVLAVVFLVQVSQAAPVRAYPERPKLDVKFPQNVGSSWVKCITDTLVNGSFKLLTPTLYSAMPIRQDSLRIISGSTADSSYVILYGITSSDSIGAALVEERLRISGTDSVYSGKRWAGFEGVSCDSESAGTLIIVGKRSWAAPRCSTSVLPGILVSGPALHFTGARSGGITSWAAALDTTTNAGQPNCVVRAELRVYPDFKDIAATPETGYYVADRAMLTMGTITATASSNSGGRSLERSFVSEWGKPLFIPSHAAVAIFAASSATLSNVRVTGSLVGYDSSSP